MGKDTFISDSIIEQISEQNEPIKNQWIIVVTIFLGAVIVYFYNFSPKNGNKK